MATAALNAYSSAAAIPVVGYTIAPIAAAMAVAACVMQVAAIKKQQQASQAQGYAERGALHAVTTHKPKVERRGVRLAGATGGAPRGSVLHVLGFLAHCVIPHADYRAAALCNRQRVAGKHAQHPVAARHRGFHAKA